MNIKRYLNMEIEDKINYTKSLKEAGISYLGNYSQSAKMKASRRNGTITYCIYLAPANMSGYEVCPCSQFCRKFCLNGSGVNRVEINAHGAEESRINKSRIRKTRLFFENKDLFMKIMIHEIIKTKRYAEKHNMEFSVRLNGTSDISPEDFVYNGKNILQIFPDIQFYDYTKSFDRINLLKKYNNYFLTFSFDGHNWDKCDDFLKKGGQVAVVFDSLKMPEYFNGYKVLDGNSYDMRYLDDTKSIIYLKYHKTAANYIKNPITGKREYHSPKGSFVIHENDSRIEW